MPLPDAGRSGGKDPSAQLFTEVLRHVPDILNLVPSESAYSVACTCWPALLAVLQQHGRRCTEEGECEWTRDFSVRRDGEYKLDLTSKRLTVPVLRLSSKHSSWPADGDSNPLSIALLQGLARKVEAGSEYAGELEYAGARVRVQDAAALLAAVVAAGVDAASLLEHDVEELAKVLEASERPEATRLRVTRLKVHYWPFRWGADSERASSLRRVLGTLAVRENVRLIDMSGIKMDAPTAAEVLGSLSTCHALETLNLRGNTLSLTAYQRMCILPGTLDGLAAARALAKTVKTSTSLRELDISKTDLPKGGVRIVARAVLETRTIKKLVFHNMPHGDAFAEEFVRTQGGALDTLDIQGYSGMSEEWRRKLLANAAKLAHLHFDNFDSAGSLHSSPGTPVMQPLASLVQSTTILRTLDLLLKSADVEALCKAITSNPALPLERLILWSDGVGNDGARAVAAMLMRNTTLREVALGFRDRDVAGFDHIAEALSGNTTLRKFNLENARMTADSFAKLARAVASSRLEVFIMVYAKFPTHSTINIADLSKSSTLRHIHLDPSWESEDAADWGWKVLKLAGVVDFAAGLAQNSVLRILTLSHFTGFRESDAFEALANALRTNTALRSLTLTGGCCSNWGSEGFVHALAQALRDNRGLRSVELGHDISHTSDDVKQVMVEALRENTTLERLHLGGLLPAGRWDDIIKHVDGPSPRIVLQDTP